MTAILLVVFALALGFFIGRAYERTLQEDERERRWQEHQKCRCETKR